MNCSVFLRFMDFSQYIFRSRFKELNISLLQFYTSIIMIEFQLTIYMCSYCTRVHNAAHDCVRHELEEHATTNTPKSTATVDDAENGDVATTSSTLLPFTIADDEVKPDVNDSYIQRYSSLDTEGGENQEPVENEIGNVTKEIIGEASAVARDSNTKSEERDVDLPSTSHLFTRRQPKKTAVKKTVKPSSATTHNLKNDSTVTYSRQKVPCKVCKKVRFLFMFISIFTNLSFRL